MAKGWYVLHVYSGFEKKVEEAINDLIRESNKQNNKISKILYQVKIPLKEITEIKNGKKKTSEKKVFPGYVLLEMDLSQNNWQDIYPVIKNIYGVTGFVGANKLKKPIPLMNEEVRQVLSIGSDTKNEIFLKQKYDFGKGDTVKVIDGPFSSFSGTIEEINLEKNKLKVMVNIFGRPTPVELDFTQVEKI